MWPNEYTMWLLLAGLMPLVYASWLAVRYGVKELSSLRFIGVLFIWIGYHFSPWQSFLTGEMWDHYLLVPGQINAGLLFTTLAMVAFLIGYSQVFPRKLARFRKHMPTKFALPKVKPGWVLGMCVIVLIITIITLGGVDEFWSSRFPRGYGQFDARDFMGKLDRMLTVIRLPLEVILGLMGALLMLRAKGSKSGYILAFIALMVASLSSMWSFSRAAGFPFLFLAFFAIRMNVRHSLAIALPCVALALYLGSVGFHERGNYYPGIANYFQGAFLGWNEQDASWGRDQDYIIANPLDAMAPFTRKAEQRASDSPSLFYHGLKFVWNLNPLPSEVVPVFSLGRSLSEVMGTYGHVGITTPSFAELYYVFGLSGFFIAALLGTGFAWFERRAVLYPSTINSIGITLVFLSMPVGLHNSMRAMTRPLMYALFLILAGRIIFRPRMGHRTSQTTANKIGNFGR